MATASNSGIFSFLIEAIHTLVSPRICEVCSSRILSPSGISKHICFDCLSGMPAFPDPNIVKNELFSNYSARELAISSAFALMRISADHPWFQLVRALKYDSMPEIGYELGLILGAKLVETGNCSFSAVVPVPIHSARLRERGYNQADPIAKGIAQATQTVFRNDIASRNKYTSSQTKLSRTERKENVSDVFVTNGRLKLPEKVLVVDDVLTTGATMNSVAIALLSAGVVRVDVAALVKA